MTSTEVATRAGNKPSRGGAKKGVAKASYDWEVIKAAYVEGMEKPKKNANDPEEREWPTLQEVADRFGVKPPTVRKRSAEERWPEQRAAYQARLAHSRQRRRILSLGKEAVEFDGKALGVAKLGITMVQARLGEIARDVQVQSARRAQADARAAAGLVVDPEDYATVIDARELSTLATAASQYQSLARIALGENIIRHEHTGTDGAPIEVEVEAEVTHTVKDEMQRPDRMTAILDGLARAGLLDDDNIIDADVEEDEDDDDDDN